MLRLAEAYFGNVHELMECLHPGLDRQRVQRVQVEPLVFREQKRRDGEDIEQVDPKDGCRPLHAAVITEQEEAVAYLLRKLGFEARSCTHNSLTTTIELF